MSGQPTSVEVISRVSRPAFAAAMISSSLLRRVGVTASCGPCLVWLGPVFQRSVVRNRTRIPRTWARLMPSRYGRNGSPM